MKNLKKTTQVFPLLIALFMIGTTVMAQSTWKVDPAHAKVTFSTVHNTISDVEGLFNSFEATVTASKEDFSDAVFDLTIAVESIDTEIKMRDDHLKSADFFDVEKYPSITYKSTSIAKGKEANHYVMKGELTMHGVTKSVDMNLWYRGTITDSQSGNVISGFQVSGEISRSAFEIGANFPEALISDEIVIKADGEFIKQ